MNRRFASAIFALISVMVPAFGKAEDLNEIFKRVQEFAAQKNYPKALEELAWARKELEKLNSSSMTSFFPDTLNGYTGEKPQVSNALGMTTIERRYKKSESAVKLSIVSGGAGGAFGGLAEIGKMAAMFGGQPGQDTTRIQGRTAILQENGGYPEMQVFLDSGAVLTISGEDGVDGSVLTSMAEALKLSDIDTYLRGQNRN